MWGRLILLVLVVTGLVGATGIPRADAKPRPQSYDVLYTGSGTFDSVVQTLSSAACGSVTSHRTETTSFSWSTDYNLRVGFGSAGAGFIGATVRTQPAPLASASNRVTVVLSVSGCISGIAGCVGQTRPAPGRPSRLEVPNVPRGGRAVFGVDAVAAFYGFTGANFFGGWSPQLTGFSCDGEYNDALALVPLFDPASALRASISVQLSRLRSLPRGQSIVFQTSPGQNGAPGPLACPPADGCVSEHMLWQGQVKVTRSS